jgi:tetratricopeptide (TPR) repeat protein
MRTAFPKIGLIGLIIAAVISTAALSPGDAYAQDENRRVLRARHMEDTDMSEEYARLAESKRLESIRFLKELLAEGTAEGERKAEMMLRLADLYFQQGRAIFLREMWLFDQEVDRCFNIEGCDIEAVEADTAESRDWQLKAIRLYEHILEHYPRYARADEATYYLASALGDIGRAEEGNDYFKRLVKLFPDSHFVPDAFVQIGEYYFDHDNAYKALLAYKKATAYREHDKYGFAMYKLAWCYYNVGEYGKSIVTMKAVVAYSMAQVQAGAAGSKLELGEEALKDLVRFFADAGELDEAYEYFNKLGKTDLIHSLLKRLATTYMENGQWEEAVATYRRLIAEDPQNARDPEYQHEIVQAYQKMGNSEATFAEVDRMLKTYGPNTAWARANASDQEAIRRAQEKIERDLLQVATYHHDRGRKLHGPEQASSFDLAYRAYTVYLGEFPDSTHSYDVHYQFAELLYKIEKYDEAYVQYVAVVEMDANGKHSKFCAESAIFAADEMVKEEQAANPTRSSSGVEPIALTDWETKLVESCDRYARLYPHDDKVRNIIYKSAYLLYHKHQLEKSADRFRTVIEMEPQSDEAEKAAHLILDSFVLTEDWGNLKKNSKFFHDQEGLGSRTFKREVYEIYQRASLKVVEVDFERNTDYGATADAYMAFYDEFQESEELARILNNAALYYREAGRTADSMKTRQILVEDPRFGDSTKYYYTQVGALGFDYETVADFDQAAHYYERMFALYPDERKTQVRERADDEVLAAMDTEASDAIYSAAVFRHAQGNWKQSIANYKQFVAAYPQDDRVDAVNIKMGQIYEDNSEWGQAGTVFYNFYTQAGADTELEMVYYARLRYAKALEKQQQFTKAKRVYEETVTLYTRFLEGGGEPGPYTDYVAEMMFILAQPIFDSFDEKKITGCSCTSRKREDKVIGDTLKAKALGLLEVEKTYTEIIKTGSGEWGLAALVQLGRAYESMGDALRDSAVPFYLTDDQREIYLMRLEDKIYPQTQKAIEAYKAALEKSHELTLYNEDTAFATRRLGVLASEDYPGLEEEVVVPNLTSRSTRAFTFETEL